MNKEMTKLKIQIKMQSKVYFSIIPSYIFIHNSDKFTFLGSTVAMNGECLIDVKCRLSKAAPVMTKLGTMWKNKSISQKTKLKLYRSNVLSVLLYGAECWSLTAGIEKSSLHSIRNA